MRTLVAQKYLPQKILKTVNLDALTPCPEIHINKHLKPSESDVIYKVEISGKLGYILATEHQHKSERFMPLRVLEYDLEIWGFHRKQYPEAQKLPLIINLVFSIRAKLPIPILPILKTCWMHPET